MGRAAAEAYNQLDSRAAKRAPNLEWRWLVIKIIFCLATLVIIARLGQLQIMDHTFYAGLASGQRELYSQLFPKRGVIYAAERSADGSTKNVPLAINRKAYLVYADTRVVTDAEKRSEERRVGKEGRSRW